MSASFLGKQPTTLTPPFDIMSIVSFSLETTSPSGHDTYREFDGGPDVLDLSDVMCGDRSQNNHLQGLLFGRRTPASPGSERSKPLAGSIHCKMFIPSLDLFSFHPSSMFS